MKIEEELTGICDNIIALVSKYLLPKCKSDEGKVFLYKMLGDYYRYIAEYSSGENKNKSATQA
jgi:14-3-3 protein epsilon